MSAKIFSFLFISLSLVCKLPAQEIPNKKLHLLVVKGIDQTLRQEYDSAKATYSFIIKEYPAHPSGYLYYAATLQAEFADYKGRFDEKKFDSLIEAGQSCAQKMIQQGVEDWGYYYSGLAYAYHSFSVKENGNIAKGLLLGFNAGNQMQHCLEINPKFYSAMNVLGSFYFWKSQLSWLPFISNKKEEGISFIRQAIEHSMYERILGKNNLLVMYYEEGKYRDALHVGLSVLKEYPNNRNFLWGIMKVADKLHNDSLLEQIVDTLLTSSLQAPVKNYYREAVCRMYKAEIAFKEKNFSVAALESRKVIALRPYRSVANADLGKKIERAEELLQESLLKVKE